MVIGFPRDSLLYLHPLYTKNMACIPSILSIKKKICKLSLFHTKQASWMFESRYLMLHIPTKNMKIFLVFPQQSINFTTTNRLYKGISTRYCIYLYSQSSNQNNFSTLFMFSCFYSFKKNFFCWSFIISIKLTI